jgi:hypothetical protein
VHHRAGRGQRSRPPAPTRAEINAGTDVSNEIAAITGWAITSEMQPTPDLGKRFVSQVPGRLTAADSGITFWADKTGTDIRSLLELDQDTFVVWMDGGDVTASLMDVFKVTVTQVAKLREIEGVGRIDTKFAIRDYRENLAIPATV